MNAKKLLPLTGVLGVVLLVAGFVVGGETPDADDSARKVAEFYIENSGSQMASAYLVVIAGAMFVFFATIVRRSITSAGGNQDLATAGFAGSIIVAVGLGLLASCVYALGELGEDLLPSSMQAINALSYEFFGVVALGLGVYGIPNGIAIAKSGGGGLPKWMGWVAIVFGVLVFAGPVGFFGFMLFALWTLVASVMLTAKANA